MPQTLRVPIRCLPFSFLVSFAKRTFTVNEQIKLIHDFLGVSKPCTIGAAEAQWLTLTFPVHRSENEANRAVEIADGSRI